MYMQATFLHIYLPKSCFNTTAVTSGSAFSVTNEGRLDAWDEIEK